jgi:hypothetical protein
LDIDRSFDNYMDFRKEFDSVLASNIWIMDWA